MGLFDKMKSAVTEEATIRIDSPRHGVDREADSMPFQVTVTGKKDCLVKEVEVRLIKEEREDGTWRSRGTESHKLPGFHIAAGQVVTLDGVISTRAVFGGSGLLGQVGRFVDAFDGERERYTFKAWARTDGSMNPGDDTVHL